MRAAERCFRLLVLSAWMALLTYWSGQGNLPIDQPVVANALHGFQHRIAHVFAFGLLGLLAQWAFGRASRAAVWAVVLTSLFGAADEWHQSFTAGRRPSIDDWAVDTAAASLALFVYARLRTRRFEPYLRALSPAVVAAAFTVGVVLAARPAQGPDGLSVRTAAHATLQLVRDARNVSRNVVHQLRASVAG